MEKKYDYLDRLIAFAGDIILFVESLPARSAGSYLYSQILGSCGSAALNFAESQAAVSHKDYLNKTGIALKELNETEVNLRIMKYVKYGGEKRHAFHQENVELIKILSTIIKNRKTASLS